MASHVQDTRSENPKRQVKMTRSTSRRRSSWEIERGHPVRGQQALHAGHMRRRERDGTPVMFVADPAHAPRAGDLVYARPDDLADDGRIWRDWLLEYNRLPGSNPLKLLPAFELYENRHARWQAHFQRSIIRAATRARFCRPWPRQREMHQGANAEKASRTKRLTRRRPPHQGPRAAGSPRSTS